MSAREHTDGSLSKTGSMTVNVNISTSSRMRRLIKVSSKSKTLSGSKSIGPTAFDPDFDFDVTNR